MKVPPPDTPLGLGLCNTGLLQNQTGKKKAVKHYCLTALSYFGRCERIRTFDPLHPMQVRYQAAPHTDKTAIIY